MNARHRRFEGKVALVTGSSTGIGAAIATQLAQEGAAVGLVGRRAHLLEAKAAELRAAGHEVVAVPGDISTDAQAIVQVVVDRFGRLDVLVNNAAVSAGMGVEEMPFEAWRHVMAINLDGAFAMVQAAVPHLIASRGNILHISSISSIAGEFDDAAYAASKAGLEGLSRKLALELARLGVRSNVIRPGLIRTEAFEGMPEDFFKAQLPLIPLGTIGQPEDIARAVAFLCSDEARFITGAVLTIDGGESAK
ncbi:SDR family oxidoreductase [Litorilinea aerophila]|uniref:SDR family oxidoreductase n=1 Tax=Litorilinea aerophila TaxID=1204385 RepID=A0A540V9L1_9CHLR|nr:SDR family oxidoreductase [Litorilinea aerophila]MCC9078630.1 SDR family oxidoreductase [Litorilinea aerophila]GIV77413.1 MAG: 3-oxoacyl-ACP reductase [Litorilinea sp.]